MNNVPLGIDWSTVSLEMAKSTKKTTKRTRGKKSAPAKPHSMADSREMRPYAIHSKKHGQTFILGHNEIYRNGDRSITFSQPNNIALCLEIGNRAYDQAAEMFLKNIKPRMAKSGNVEFEKADLPSLYDYFQQLQISLLFVYTAVEAFANLAIPEDYELTRLNAKKVKEVWNKDSIERWFPTTEKIGDVVPSILKIKSPKQEPFWSLFKELESLRDEIVHQKTTNNETNVSSRFLRSFFDKRVFEVVRSGFLVIQHMCSLSPVTHIYFPLGMGNPMLTPLFVDDFDTHFRPTEEQDSSDMGKG